MPKEDTTFIEKLHNLIEAQNTATVEWDKSGKGFIVNNLQQFTNQVLLRKFSITRLDSFARKVGSLATQLNKYGFKRSKIDKNRIRFFHIHFSRDGSSIHKIQKLNKEDTIPKHIKLRLIRDQLTKETMSDQEIGSYLAKCEDQSQEAVRRFEIVDGNFVLIPMGVPLDSISRPITTFTFEERLASTDNFGTKFQDQAMKLFSDN